MKPNLILLLHSIIALILVFLSGVIYFKKNIIVSGKLVGNVFELQSPAHILVALSFLFAAIVMILMLHSNKKILSLAKWLAILGVILFTVGFFM